MRFAALILGGLITALLPSQAHGQSAGAVFQDNYAEVNGIRRAHTGFVDAEVRNGHYTEEDRQRWIDAWSQAGSTTGGLSYYRANNRNAPFNDLHPASTIPHSWSAKEVTEGAKSIIVKVPTLVLWGMKDTALLVGNISGLDKWVPNLSVKLYPDDDHWVMIEKYKEVSQDVRRFIEGKDFPKESVYRAKLR